MYSKNELIKFYKKETNIKVKERLLLDDNCKIEKVQPSFFTSDAEVNIVIVTVVCPDGNRQTIKAYREEAQALREFIRTYVDR